MDWSNRIILRAYLPGVAVFAGALVLTAFLWSLQPGLYVGAFLSTLRWVPIAAFVFSLFLLIRATYWLFRWDRGAGPICHGCGGLLGPRRKGRTDRGGEYRRCLGCGKAINHRHYESE